MLSTPKRYLFFFLAWLVPVLIGSYVRLYPLTHYHSSEAEEKATIAVIGQLKAKVSESTEKKFSQASNLEKSRLAKEGFDEILHQKHKKVREMIDDMALEIDAKNPSLEKFYPYLLEADPYLYYELTENILKTGKLADTVKGSKYFNKRMLAPEGHFEPLNLHPFVGFLTYKVLKIFKPNISLMEAVSFTPVFLAALTVIPFLIVLNLLECNIVFSAIGAIFFMIAPIFVKRSAFGWYDNDPYNILFPLLILALLFSGLNARNDQKKCLSWAAALGAAMTLYAYFWQGWMYLFCVIIFSAAAIILYNHLVLKSHKKTSAVTVYFAVIFSGTFIGVGLCFGFNDFFALFKEGWTALKNFLSPQLSLWPDLYIGVGELRKNSLWDLIEQDGNFILFILALIGFTYCVFKVLKRKEKDPFKFIVLAILFCISFVMALKAQRFNLLSLSPLAIFYTLGLEKSFYTFKKIFFKIFSIKEKSKAAFVFLGSCSLALLIFAWFTFSKAEDAIFEWRPIFNDTWQKALTEVKERTPPESIVTTWWPPGHFITAIANRRVTFDGATINFPQAYWLANVFLAQDEKKAVGLLRMLNNSANEAAEYLQKTGMKLSNAVKILYEITPLSRAHAQNFLKDYLSINQINHLLNLTHKTPPPSYLLVYDDLMEKNLELSFVGKWNFRKVEEIQNDSELLEKVPPRNSKAYITYLWELAGGPLNYTSPLSELGQKDSILVFEQGIQINLSDMSAHVTSKKYGRGIPQSIICLQNETVAETKLKDSNLPYSLFLFEDGGRYGCALVDPRLGKSLLYRLYYLGGKGLKYIKPFIRETDPLTKRTRIYVYKIDWKVFEENLK